MEEKEDIGSNLESKDSERVQCSCEEAIDKFIISTATRNDSFEIQGSFFEKKTIHLNYYGKLIDKEQINQERENRPCKNIYIHYCFDNKWDKKKIINMATCKKNPDLSYCANIYLPNKSVLYLAFTDDFDNWDTDTNSTYFFKVYPNKENEIIIRYGLDDSNNDKKDNTSSLSIYSKYYKSFNIYFKNFTQKLNYFLKTTLFSKDC